MDRSPQHIPHLKYLSLSTQSSATLRHTLLEKLPIIGAPFEPADPFFFPFMLQSRLVLFSPRQGSTAVNLAYLSVDLPRLSQPLNVYEVIGAPLRPELVQLPLLEDVEQSEVIALGHEEFFSRRVRLFLAILERSVVCSGQGVASTDEPITELITTFFY